MFFAAINGDMFMTRWWTLESCAADARRRGRGSPRSGARLEISRVVRSGDFSR